MNVRLPAYSIPLFCAAFACFFAPAAYSMGLGGSFPPQQSLVVQATGERSVDGAKAFVDNMAMRGIGFLGNEQLTEEQRVAEFRKLLNSSFDMATIGRFALGRNWKVATPAQQAEYQKLFKEMIVKTYSRRFSDYKGQSLKVLSARTDGDNDVIVSSAIVPADGQEVSVDWRVRGKGGGYKIVDILVEGVSMALTQRSDFASVIQRGGGSIEVLLVQLRQQ